ncbi:hypothetical protein EGM88_11720 [Aureibaculum marinum]|uniref:Uncharacterized protein n=1 Tax=Aureibaculum marinum TaxID=2487930 RepID=A0A3N4NMU3_9FLAO|nr:hypothetical protein [Aureibaculum marinum]RPD95878.1 hypothetical protein EGM88_11720 [Aureibaculum marinum]
MKVLIIVLIISVNFVVSSQEKIILSKAVLNDLTILYENDQKYRLKLSPIGIDSLSFFEVDSLSIDDKINKMNELFIKNRKNSFIYKNNVDSLWNLQHQIDVQNSQKLFKIINKYGYLNQENSNCHIPLYIILMHTPAQYKKRTLKLVEQEYEKGRINHFNYLNIIWHLNDRNGLPFEYEVVKENDSVNKQ